MANKSYILEVFHWTARGFLVANNGILFIGAETWIKKTLYAKGLGRVILFNGGRTMNKRRALELLSRGKPELRERFGVTRLALFGSTARDAATSDSDVDILVAFDGPATSKRYFGAQFYLEELLGCPIDLVTEKALRPELRPYIEREKVNV